MSNLYSVTHNTFGSRGWTFAPNIIPRSEMVDRYCKTCGSMERYPSREYDLDLENGSKYPDYLGCGAYPFFIVSEKVIQDWESENITGFSYFEVGIRSIKSKKLQGIEPPKYFNVVVNSSCELDFTQMGVKIIDQCKECHKIELSKPTWELDLLAVKDGSWDGSDLFTAKHFPRKILCSEKVLDVARRYKHTNCIIISVKDAWNSSSKNLI